LNKTRRIILAIGAAVLVIAIGIGAKRQSFAEPLSILLPITLAGEILAVVAYVFLKKQGYNTVDAFVVAAAISIFSPMTGLVTGLFDFMETTGNIGRGILHITELAVIIVAVTYLASGMEKKKIIESASGSSGG